MKRIVSLILFLALASPASAADLSRGIAAAERQWGPLACQIEVRPLPPQPETGGSVMRGYTHPDYPCVIWLDLDWLAADPHGDARCSMVQHEIGHLHGRRHVEDRDDVMHETVPSQTPECRTPGVVDPRRSDGRRRSGKRRSDRKWCRRNAELCVEHYPNLGAAALKRKVRVSAMLLSTRAQTGAGG